MPRSRHPRLRLWAGTQYAAYAVVTHRGSLPGGVGIAVASAASFAPFLALIVFLVILFPDGRLPSARWRAVPVAGVVGFALLYAIGLTNKLSAPFAAVDNPLHVKDSRLLIEVSIVIAIPLALASVIGTFAAIVVRFRRSRGDERAQLKWLVLAAAWFPIGLVGHTIADAFAPGATGTVEFLFSFAIIGIPIAIAVAVLKYRLYEIDRVISRALVYALLSIALALVYVGLVLGGQAVFSSFAGGSHLAVAVSTLVVAALFLPVRSRVQGFVDRRFYRSRYDAQRTLDAFGTRLREQVDLDALGADLHGVVGETMQPAHLSLWLPQTTTDRDISRNASVTVAQ